MTKRSKMSIFDQIERIKDPYFREEAFRPFGGRESAKRNWTLTRRPSQTAPSDDLWKLWVMSGGRGSGKTRAGIEWIKEKAESAPNLRLIIVGRTAADVREVLVEGESGILNSYAPNDPTKPIWSPIIRRLTWPNGTIAFVTSSEEVNSIRGLQAHYVFGDDVAGWRTDTDGAHLTMFDSLMIAARLGDHPQVVLATTPKKVRALKAVHRLLKRNPVKHRLTEYATEDNSSLLSRQYLKSLIGTYSGTKLAKQELEGRWPWKL